MSKIPKEIGENYQKIIAIESLGIATVVVITPTAFWVLTLLLYLYY